MNALMEAFRAALTSLMAHRMRSFLTTLGILIGTASVIAVVSLVQGFSASIKDQFADLGGGTMTLQAENNTENFRTGRLNYITFEDIDVLRYRVSGVDQVAPLMHVQAAGATYQGHTASPQIIATTTEFQQVRGTYPSHGRFLVEGDDRGARRVAVLGTQLRDDLEMEFEPETCKFVGLNAEGLLAQSENFATRLELTTDDRFWTPLPLFHIGGRTQPLRRSIVSNT